MWYLSAYLLGVVVALAVMRDPWPARVGTALLWPLGPLAFVAVVIILVVASLMLWPLLLVPAAAILGALAWWLT